MRREARGRAVKQLNKFCAALRDCYLAADKGKLPASDCFKMATQSGTRNECEAYTVSVPCVEQSPQDSTRVQDSGEPALRRRRTSSMLPYKRD